MSTDKEFEKILADYEWNKSTALPGNQHDLDGKTNVVAAIEPDGDVVYWVGTGEPKGEGMIARSRCGRVTRSGRPCRNQSPCRYHQGRE